MSKIIGNTTTTTSPQSDCNQTDPTKADYIKNKPVLGTLASKSTVEKSDVAIDIQVSLNKADTAIQSLDGYATEDFVNDKIAYVTYDTESSILSTTYSNIVDKYNNGSCVLLIYGKYSESAGTYTGNILILTRITSGYLLFEGMDSETILRTAKITSDNILTTETKDVGMKSLTFTGGSTGTYDGSSALTVDIPEDKNFVINLTETWNDGVCTITGDKTYTDVLNAYNDGMNIYCKVVTNRYTDGEVIYVHLYSFIGETFLFLAWDDIECIMYRIESTADWSYDYTSMLPNSVGQSNKVLTAQGNGNVIWKDVPSEVFYVTITETYDSTWTNVSITCNKTYEEILSAYNNGISIQGKMVSNMYDDGTSFALKMDCYFEDSFWFSCTANGYDTFNYSYQVGSSGCSRMKNTLILPEYDKANDVGKFLTIGADGYPTWVSLTNANGVSF